MYVLGIDTSNYTTSLALIDENKNVIQRKKLLPVKMQDIKKGSVKKNVKTYFPE